jgi:hypothetical protein
MEYNIQGKVSFNVDFDIEANSEEEAIELAKERIIDNYYLNSHGDLHNIGSEKFDLDAGEYED